MTATKYRKSRLRPVPPHGNAESLDVHWVFIAAAQLIAFWVMEFPPPHRPAGAAP